MAPPDPVDTGGTKETSPQPTTLPVPDQRTATPAWAGGSVTGGITTRSFAQILEDEKKDRNILEIQLNCNTITSESGSQSKAKNLTYEDIGELLFDILEINPEDCISFNFNTGRYDQREIKFKPKIDTTPYIRVLPFTFKDHSITVKKQRQNITRVTFRNVPLNVPDEEILTLCACYGKSVDSIVHYERLNNIRGRGLTGSTRFVDVELDEGKTFENYYWMEGPLPGDVGKRIVVLHNGQTTQCSHCLRRAGAGCPAMGIGKACQMGGTPRAKMNNYMQSLKNKVGYVSMKIKYIEQQAKMFPSLLGFPGEKSSEQELEGAWSMEEGENGKMTAILNPIEERDKTICEQKQQIDLLCKNQQKANTLNEDFEKIKAENLTLKKKINYTRKATEQRILENISNNEFYRDDPLLVAVLSATLNDEEFEFENSQENMDAILSNSSPKLERKSRKDLFMSSIEAKIDINDSTQTERFSHIKNQVIEKIKTSKIRRSMSSTSSKRRLSFLCNEDDSSRTPSRPRTASPPAQ